MFRTETLWIAAFLATGLVGGLIYNWPDLSGVESETSPATTVDGKFEQLAATPQNDVWSDASGDTGDNPQSNGPPPANDPEAASESAETGDIWSDLAPGAKRTQPIDTSVRDLGDRLLLGGNAAGAYQHYSKLWKQANLPMDPAVLIRLALAAEMAGMYDESGKHYRSAIRVSAKGSVRQLICFLGTARLWEKQGQLEDAISLLSELHLRFSDERQPELIRQSIVRQLGDCLQKRLLRSPVVAEAIAGEPMEYHWSEPILDQILTAADTETNTLDDEKPDPGIRVLQNPRGEVSLILMEIHRGGYAVLDLLADIERLTELKIELTERAKSTTVGRLTNIDTNAMPLSLLLDQSLEFLELAWSQEGETVRVMHRDELTATDAASFHLGKTQRMLRQTQMLFSNGPVRTGALMNDANNCRLSGEWETAAEKYRAAREAEPMQELSAKLYFNSATLDLLNDDKLAALHACYMTLDQTLVTSLQAQVYAMIAELELELGQPQKAITAGGRGLRRAQDTEIVTTAALTLARAYLIDGDPDSANSVLFNHSDQISGAKAQRLASVFSTYARYLRVRPQSGLQDEGQRLVMALAALEPGDASDFIDSLLISNAYASIGVRTKAIENLRRALEEAPEGFWREQIRMDLAKALFDASDFTAANSVIEGFQNVSADRLAVALQLHARIQLALGELETTEAVCRRLLAMEIDDATKSQTLNLLGQVFRTQGKHYAAALCFAGVLPNVESEAADASTLQPRP